MEPMLHKTLQLLAHSPTLAHLEPVGCLPLVLLLLLQPELPNLKEEGGREQVMWGGRRVWVNSQGRREDRGTMGKDGVRKERQRVREGGEKMAS